MKYYSDRTMEALAEAVTGGSASSNSKSIGVYRTAWDLHKFFKSIGLKFNVGRDSRVPAVTNFLVEMNNRDGGEHDIVLVFDAVVDTRDFFGRNERLVAVVDYLNSYLEFDGFKLAKKGSTYHLTCLPNSDVSSSKLRSLVTKFDFDSVGDDFERALLQADSDPAGAIRASCSTVESVCKCILGEIGVPYPNNQDVASLVKEIERVLKLSPTRPDIEPEIKQILGGLSNVSRGLGALRTHSSDAHGRGKKIKKVDSRIARLAINSANTISQFLIETWRLQSGNSQTN